jgi:uncharacterized protein YciI
LKLVPDANIYADYIEPLNWNKLARSCSIFP